MTPTPLKLRLLYIEDEDDFRQDLVSSLQTKFEVSPIDVSEFLFIQNGGEIGEQFQAWLTKQVGNDPAIDGVILDSDLSGFSNGISKEMLLSTFRELGIPVCRYSKRQKQSPSERLKHYATLASEGAASILVPSNLLNGPTDSTHARTATLTDWLHGAFNGFLTIRQAYSEVIQSGTVRHNAPELLATLLRKPNLELDFVGYTGAGLFFFGDVISVPSETPTQEQIARSIATKLGYWLFNYIIAFPGPILNVPAAAAFAGVNSEGVDHAEFERAFHKAKYAGPFAECHSMFVREELEALLMESGITGIDTLIAAGVSTARPIYEVDPFQAGVYCIATDASIKREDGIGPLDWIPGGASELCRVERKTYSRFMPWLNV